MRRTQALEKVAAVLMADPDGKHYGYDTGKKARLRSGVLYPILHRLHDAGWLTDGWEAQPDGLPPRRYYELTDLGQRELGGNRQ